MKTVQEYLRQADREELLDAFAYNALCDVHQLLEHPDKTIEQLQDACKANINRLIDHLLSLDAEPSDHKVLYMVDSSSFDRKFNNEYHSLNLINLKEVRKDIYASSYGFDLIDWRETLGYLVADNKMTQDYMTDLLTQYLYEITFFGTDPEDHQKSIDEIWADLEQSKKDIEEGGQTVPADEVFEELRKENGWPEDEKDEIQDQLHSEIMDAELKYSRYCDWRERSRILKSLGEPAPTFEEAEEKRKETGE